MAGITMTTRLSFLRLSLSLHIKTYPFHITTRVLIPENYTECSASSRITYNTIPCILHMNMARTVFC